MTWRGVIETAERVRQSVHLNGGSRVVFAEYGDPKGFPILALHGAPACRLMFTAGDKTAKALNLRLIAPDRPGYGLTPPDNNVSLKLRTEWLREFIDILSVDRFAILAISGGSPYGISLAALLQDRVLSLALVSPMGPVADYSKTPEGQAVPLSFLHEQFFLNLPPRMVLKQPLANIGAWALKKVPDFFAGLLSRMTTTEDALILSRPFIKHYLTEMMVEALRQGGGGTMQDLEIFSQPWGISYGKIKLPVEIWQGTADTIVPSQVVEWLACQLPSCKLHLIKNAGHFWIFDHVNEVLSSLSQGLPKHFTI